MILIEILRSRKTEAFKERAWSNIPNNTNRGVVYPFGQSDLIYN